MTAETSVENTASATEQQPTGAATPETSQPNTAIEGGVQDDGNKDGMKEAPPWLQKRFSQVISQKNNLKSEVEQLRGRLQELEARTAVPEKPVEKGQFANETDYIKAIASQQAQEILKQERQAQAQAQVAQEQAHGLQQVWTQQVAEVADFAQAIEAAEMQGLQVPSAVKAALDMSPDRPKVAYYLSKNPSEAQRLFAVPQSQLEREIIRLELRSEDYWNSARQTVQQQTSKPTTMPKPNGKSANAAPSIETLSGDDYLREHRRLQTEARKKARR
jgi:hypothetical protein